MPGIATVVWVGALALKAVAGSVVLLGYAENHGGVDVLADGVRSIPGLLAAFLPTPGGEGV
jgi:hypothetical protein